MQSTGPGLQSRGFEDMLCSLPELYCRRMFDFAIGLMVFTYKMR